MTAHSVVGRVSSFPVLARLPRLPHLALRVLAGLLIVGFVSTWFHLAVPSVTGPHSVGRAEFVWSDATRLEPGTADPGDFRSVPVQVWYPAQPGTGSSAAYIHNLDEIASGLVSSGELGWVEVRALQYVRDQALSDAELVSSAQKFPLIILSPGNATNVAFYASVAEDLASHGYIVVGVDHPFQVAAVHLPSGELALYEERPDGEKFTERVADIRYVFDRLALDPPSLLAGRVDTENVAVIGHSNGGIAAAESCGADPRFVACVNVDGQNAGGPFGHTMQADAPAQAFLFLTKETEVHPEIARRFEASDEAIRVVVPWAEHADFTDGGRFVPSLTPVPRAVDNVMETTRGVLLAFLDRWLRNGEEGFEGLPAAADIFINIYPLEDNPPIP